jgi:hypothetical protein
MTFYDFFSLEDVGITKKILKILYRVDVVTQGPQLRGAWQLFAALQ